MKNKRLKICHVVLSLRPGGLENGVVNVINGLDSREFESSVCCLKDKGEFAARIRDPAVRVVEMGWRTGNDPLLPLRLAVLFRRLGADIVHTRNAEAFFYGMAGATLARVPHVIHSEHGRTFPETPLRALLQRRLLGFVDYVFAVSGRLRDDLVREIGVSRERVGIIYNGVDLQRFSAESPGSGRPAQVAEEVLIGSVGRLVAVKNYQLLLRALAALAVAPPWRLVLVGDGPERARLESLAVELGIRERVEFLGHRDDVPPLLQGMAVFVLPSVSEGLSNTLLEAMAAGTAIVASDVGGNKEIVADEVSGLLFDSDDLDGLTRALSRLVNDSVLRKRLSGAATQMVRERFSIEVMLRRYEEMYRRVADGGRP
jgi:sugar transferase (PEP-CTERM/EpsH1 system associated)